MNDANRLSRLRQYLLSDSTNLSLAADALDCAIELRDVEAAAALLREALSVHGPVPMLRYRQGVLALLEGHPAEAREVFLTLQEGDASNPVLTHMIALADFEAHDLPAALDGAQAALALSAPTPGALGLALRAAHLLGRFDTAASLLERHAASIDGDPDALGAASLVALDMVDAERARRWSVAALALDPTQLEALVSAGTLALQSGRDDDARQYLERAIARRGNAGRAWSALGIVELGAGHPAIAEAHFEKALETLPKHIGTWHALGWCRTLEGKLAQARTCFDTALALDHNFSESHGALAVVDALLGARAQAEASLAVAVRLDRRSVSAQFAQGILSGEIKDRESLQRFARRVMLSAPRATPGLPPASTALH